jgi:hypothetical protein
MEKNLSPLINTDVRIPEDMFEALLINEVNWICKRIDAVSEEDVKGFLAEEYGQKMANRFKPKYLFPA